MCNHAHSPAERCAVAIGTLASRRTHLSLMLPRSITSSSLVCCFCVCPPNRPLSVVYCGLFCCIVFVGRPLYCRCRPNRLCLSYSCLVRRSLECRVFLVHRMGTIGDHNQSNRPEALVGRVCTTLVGRATCCRRLSGERRWLSHRWLVPGHVSHKCIVSGSESILTFP